ncbi:3-oxoacyl-reductase [Aulographum hederae CBS 113979]|uniref:3-oxoacyl-reductase n=1 Tax=Aulographum hederae CBS 113979 TaxID=1176131 RepID=A0A6G1GPJ9_9PEZI|nr:3-oxoacyl-reductase [Aulographum hederae CBS 113979]
MSYADVKGKNIIVTGGAGGIGGAIAKLLAAEGANVYSFDINDALGEKVASEATALGPGTLKYTHVDLSSRTATFSAVESAAQDLGGVLHAIVNVAGIGGYEMIDSISEASWDRMMNIHVKGTLFMCQAAFPFLKAAGEASIVNCGSDAGITGIAGVSAYSAAKGAIMGFTRACAAEWGQYWIRVNCFNPAAATGMDQTMLDKFTEEQRRDHERIIRERCPLGGKMGDAERDVAPVVVFLCSRASRFVTGQLVPVNGGMTNAR